MSTGWPDALIGAALLAIDPDGLGGAVVHGRALGARDVWLDHFKSLLAHDAPIRRVPANIDEDRLMGGLDLVATLEARRPVLARGIIAEANGGALLLAMSERCGMDVAARLAAAIDLGEVRVERDGITRVEPARCAVIALDEGLSADERTPRILADRVAFHLYLDDVAASPPSDIDHSDIKAARAILRRSVTDGASEDLIRSVCEAASALGVFEARAALFTLRAARAAAALRGASDVNEDDLALAARLVLGPRMALADAPDASPPEIQPEPLESQSETPPSNGMTERVVDAVRAAMPEDVLRRFLEAREQRRAKARARGAGAQARALARGRQSGVRAGVPRAGQRLDLVATLRTAAPWQKLRRAESDREGVLVRASDMRLRKFVQRLEATTIVVVDASGSAALQRLAEAKGAVEHLLARAYVSRSRVALIAFRERAADVLLPPTRSLTLAKRRLADLPGGGTTPFAAAIDAAAAAALSENAKGRSPFVVFLSDGRGNVARDGEANRKRGENDSLEAARALRAAGVKALFLDTSPRAREGAQALAQAMGADYAALPYVESNAMAALVSAFSPQRR